MHYESPLLSNPLKRKTNFWPPFCCLLQAHSKYHVIRKMATLFKENERGLSIETDFRIYHFVARK